MSENLSSFLIDLASDPGLMARFLSNPTSALNGVGLDANEEAALRARDAARLRAALGGLNLAQNGQVGNGPMASIRKSPAKKKKAAKKKPAKKKKPAGKKK